MTIPLSVGDHQQFTIPHPKTSKPIIYYFKTANGITRERFKSEVKKERVRFPLDSELFAACFDFIERRVHKKDQKHWRELLDLKHKYDKKCNAALLVNKDPPTPRSQKLTKKKLADINKFYEDIYKHDEKYCHLVEDRGLFLAVVPYLAAQFFLIGWNGLDFPFRLDGSRVSDKLLQKIPHEHLVTLGFHVYNSLTPTEDAEGN